VQRLRTDFPFDVVVGAFAYPDGVAAARLAEQFGKPVVSMVLGSDINVLARDPSLRPQIRWALASSQTVIAVSDDLARLVAELDIPPERIVVQRNAVDGVRFSLRSRLAARAKLGLPPDEAIACFIGNWVEEKGPDLAIEAMSHLRRAGVTNSSLLMIGGGSLERRLRARSLELQLGRRVAFIGPKTHEEIPDFIAACDVVCLPSRREGCPNVVLEALASGRPVVASRVGGVPELITDDNGVLVPAGDAKALANGLREALGRSWDPATLRKSVACLSWDDVGSKFHQTLFSATRDWDNDVLNRPFARPPLPTSRWLKLAPDKTLRRSQEGREDDADLHRGKPT
jgi:glycosyltransferase involved in cell wall biosynthesis